LPTPAAPPDEVVLPAEPPALDPDPEGPLGPELFEHAAQTRQVAVATMHSEEE